MPTTSPLEPAVATPVATPGVASGTASIDAKPAGVAEFDALALAKVKLIDAAREIRPLQPIRDHPYVTVSVAAGAGVVLGSTGGAALALSSIVNAVASLLKSLVGLAGPLASIIAPMVASKVAASDTATTLPAATLRPMPMPPPSMPIPHRLSNRRPTVISSCG